MKPKYAKPKKPESTDAKDEKKKKGEKTEKAEPTEDGKSETVDKDEEKKESLGDDEFGIY